jgi:hypothetical protein
MLKQCLEAGVGMLRSAAALNQRKKTNHEAKKTQNSTPLQRSRAPLMTSPFDKRDKENANNLRLFWD